MRGRRGPGCRRFHRRVDQPLNEPLLRALCGRQRFGCALHRSEPRKGRGRNRAHGGSCEHRKRRPSGRRRLYLCPPAPRPDGHSGGRHRRRGPLYAHLLPRHADHDALQLRKRHPSRHRRHETPSGLSGRRGLCQRGLEPLFCPDLRHGRRRRCVRDGHLPADFRNPRGQQPRAPGQRLPFSFLEAPHSR